MIRIIKVEKILAINKKLHLNYFILLELLFYIDQCFILYIFFFVQINIKIGKGKNI